MDYMNHLTIVELKELVQTILSKQKDPEIDPRFLPNSINPETRRGCTHYCERSSELQDLAERIAHSSDVKA